MADNIEDIFVWGEDFEAILAIFEEDETIDLHFTSATNETQKEEIICKDCGEKYETKGGFERHKLAKHTTYSRSKKKERESSDTTNNSTTTHNLQEREIASLQYVGGYVLHKLYRKHAKANSKESQQAMAV
ncbi:hypothetical protein P5673_012145 [Acropora cervicornis]|uniref:C2H2-type domain-containing protein n=1 Tax=Acropora cervicornis TaxID=6130 RepID=A0AAD9V829_ACRCE|nr:hypothetical protein P5673_012145 [Acropora cervicornis]